MRRARAALVAAAALVGAMAAYSAWCEPWSRRWGATDDELDARLPVDDMVVPDAVVTTRAITVHAGIDDVWKWLVQIGQDRAGFYSYTWLENLVVAGMHNAHRVHPEWQARERGDQVWLADERRFQGRGCQVAALVDRPHGLVLVSPDDWNRLQRGERATGAWGFFLESVDEHCTRLLVRSSGGPVGTHLFDAIHFLMEQKMMRGLRDRAEAAA